MSHFVDCVLNDDEPLETGEDGRAVLEIILAAYESAATGRRVEWPYESPRGEAAAGGLGEVGSRRSDRGVRGRGAPPWPAHHCPGGT